MNAGGNIQLTGKIGNFGAICGLLSVAALTFAALTMAFFVSSDIASAAKTKSGNGETPTSRPSIYTARAIPTRSGLHIKITVFAFRAELLNMTVDGSNRLKAKPGGKGCKPFECRKWSIYTDRGTSECYELGIRARNDTGLTTQDRTVCEPFRGGSV